MSEQPELFMLEHKPMVPPRAGHLGEQAYSSMWEGLMAPHERELLDNDEQPISEVLRDMPGVITQRHATILATVVCWLGTSCGLGLLHSAKQRRERTNDAFERDYAYLFAWTLANLRSGSCNHGVRYSEYMLAPPHTRRSGDSGLWWWSTSGLTELPSLSADDMECIDHLMVWLGGDAGQEFLGWCEREEARLRRIEKIRHGAERVRLERGEPA